MSARVVNRVCFDASAACAFALDDEPHHAQALALMAALAQRNTQIIAPPLFLCECDSVIRLRIFKGVLNHAEASQMRQFIAALAVVIDDANIYDRAFEIACLTQSTAHLRRDLRGLGGSARRGIVDSR